MLPCAETDRCVSTNIVRINLRREKLRVDLTVGACDDLACSEDLDPDDRSVYTTCLENFKQGNLILTNAIDMVRSSARNEALLVLRATKRSTTAM